MLQELSHMDRITQLQDEIQQLLTIMSRSIAYLTSRANFVQVSNDIPITKQRNPEKYDPPDVFDGELRHSIQVSMFVTKSSIANKRELVTDLIVKAKQVEYLIESLPEPEAEEDQVKFMCFKGLDLSFMIQAKRLQALDEEMTVVNDEYIQAVARSKALHAQISDVLKLMLEETDTGLVETPR
ncbi:hypothetical protein B0H11DRAFT_1339821 [Mycena galericulata]|nr:hypothetical protein B0H11DRAFT_1339821 [Mycena galericulata]